MHWKSYQSPWLYQDINNSSIVDKSVLPDTLFQLPPPTRQVTPRAPVAMRHTSLASHTLRRERKGLVTLQPSRQDLRWPIRSALFVDRIRCHGVQLRHNVFSGCQHLITKPLCSIIAFLGDNSVVAAWQTLSLRLARLAPCQENSRKLVTRPSSVSIATSWLNVPPICANSQFEALCHRFSGRNRHRLSDEQIIATAIPQLFGH